MAIGVLAYLRSAKIDVPGQISVIGFDDMPIARDVTPALTTVRLPLAEIGARAMTMALDDDLGNRPPASKRSAAKSSAAKAPPHPASASPRPAR